MQANSLIFLSDADCMQWQAGSSGSRANAGRQAHAHASSDGWVPLAERQCGQRITRRQRTLAHMRGQAVSNSATASTALLAKQEKHGKQRCVGNASRGDWRKLMAMTAGGAQKNKGTKTTRVSGFFFWFLLSPRPLLTQWCNSSCLTRSREQLLSKKISKHPVSTYPLLFNYT